MKRERVLAIIIGVLVLTNVLTLIYFNMENSFLRSTVEKLRSDRDELWDKVVFLDNRRRSLEEQAVLEGAVQGALRGGSAWPILARSYLTFERLNRILKIAERHGVKRLTFHLEFTACRACRNVGAGLRGICSFCLSASVSHLIRPLTLYKPLDSIASEALEEYRSRLSLEELEEG